jgi:hypothetical protein
MNSWTVWGGRAAVSDRRVTGGYVSVTYGSVGSAATRGGTLVPAERPVPMDAPSAARP